MILKENSFVSMDQSKILPKRDDWTLRFLHIYYCMMKNKSCMMTAGSPLVLKEAKEMYLSGNEEAKESVISGSVISP